jgi:hypothetical protein
MDHPLPPSGRLARLAVLFGLVGGTALVAGCGNVEDTTAAAAAPVSSPASNPAPAPAPVALACGDVQKSYQPTDATVTLVQAFAAGEPIRLADTTGTPPTAPKDLCLVKLLVGPGNPGPASAPSSSAGIGIEIWLPAAAAWNGTIHNTGGGGWAGGADHQSTTRIATPGNAELAAAEGSVVGATDTGHAVGNGSFAMNPDGSPNATLWQDFSERSLHVLAVQTKALAAAYYGKAHRFAYWDGCSTGGRQGYKLVQTHPTDYDGYLVNAPAFNWTKFITAELYPQTVIQRDLGGVAPTAAQHALVSGKAVSACDAVGGMRLGYVLDPERCTYDPTRDASVLCVGQTGSDGVAGTNAAPECVTTVQARAFNKFWHGQTADGSVPDPAANNGFNATLTDRQLWYGLARGAALDRLAGASPFPIATDMVALELQDARLATPSFTNATGNGVDGWKALAYGQLANAFAQGVSLQSSFGAINTDDADLADAVKAGVKILSAHGLADTLIPPQGSIHYYTRVANLDGGFARTQAYNRLYLVPGMGHCAGLGSATGVPGTSPQVTEATLPLPAKGQLFGVLRDWVEKGTAPEGIILQSADATASGLVCPYPQKPTYSAAAPASSAAGYACR